MLVVTLIRLSVNVYVNFRTSYILSPSVVKSKFSNIEESGFFSACCIICKRPTRPYWSVIVVDGRPFVFVTVDDVLDNCGDVVELFVNDDDVLLLTDTWCRLISVFNASIDVLNEIGDWDCECCVCACWDELYPLVIVWWFDDDESWLW